MSASYGRSRSGNRFYNPPAVRRQLQLQQQQQQLLLQKQKQEKIEEEKQRQQQQHNSQRTKSSAESENRTESDDCASSTSTTSALAASASAAMPPSPSLASFSAPSSLSNLDRFLEHTTPLVPAQHFPKTSARRWRAQVDEFQPYFVLGDLWESFKEWSAYGAGVPLLLNGSDSVIQYYVPYLSGIQLYKDPLVPPMRSRRLGEESDAESSRASSDGSSDYETERGSVHFFQDLLEANGQGIQRLSLRNNNNTNSSKPLNGSSSDEGESSSLPGVLTFEYLEHEPPHSREPLADKISLLATRFPELRTCMSCDLSPASWVSVAWYPIYRIPTGPTLQNLDSCFLTFHSLCTATQGTQNGWQHLYDSRPREVRSSYGAMSLKLLLPTFGLASYKFKTAFWDKSGVEGCPKANSLLRATDNFLRLLNVNHPDYNFFITHNSFWR